MSRIDKLFSQEDRKIIAEAVRKAELGTTGEIVPMVVARSSVIGHVPYILTLIMITVSLGLGIAEFKVLELGLPWWSWPIWFIFYWFLALFLARSVFLQRLLTSQSDQIFQAEERAQLEFFQHQVNQTKKATGILLFVSLMEKRVVVLGDQSISQKIKPETWQEVVKLILEGIKSEKMSKGFEAGIVKCGEILSTHFPIQKNDTNELSNELILKD